MDTCRSRFGHVDPLLLAITQTGREAVTKWWCMWGAEEVLEELRCCPPAPGYESVEIPGEREREYRENTAGIVSIPKETWDQIMDLHDSLNSSS